MTIFLAEDNPADVYLLKEALASQDEPVAFVVAEDGEEALALVRSGFAGTDRPDLIVLDLNLPKSDGTDVLRSIRESGDLAGVPVITSSLSLPTRTSVEVV